jgi:carboxypeptidase C (cathepsin A)
MWTANLLSSRVLTSGVLSSIAAALVLATFAGDAAAQRPKRQQPAQTEQRPADESQPQQEQQQGPGQRQRQGQGQGQQTPRAQPQGSVLQLLPSDAVSERSIEIAGSRLSYTATAGTLPLFEQSGERAAAVFYTAYVLKTADTANRPVTFVFNGGPGAASAYLHIGAVGPRIAEFGANGRDPAAVRMQDNPDTWLPFTDLVMIDPVGTGWSRPAKPDGGTAFWGVQRDAESIAKVIALYLSRNGRSFSPKYILGESYGGFRAAKVAQVLRRDQGIAISGIVMASPLVDGALIFGATRLALGAALQLPSLAASELERKGAFSTQAQAEAEKFALTEYLTTLAGPPPQGEAARAFYAKVARMSGLPEDVVAQTRGFIRDAYIKHLRSAEGKIVSRYDATFAVDDPYPEQDSARAPDPQLEGLTRAYGGAFSAYARDELGFKTDITYVLLANDISRRWNWGEGSGGLATASIGDDVRELLALTPSFRLLVTHGYADMVTPYGVSRYMLDHLPPMSGAPRTALKLYRGGHMYYLDAESRRAFTNDAKAFYRPSP